MNTEMISSALSRGLSFCLLAEKLESGPTSSSGFLMGSQCWSQCHPLFMLLINYNLVLDNSFDVMYGLMGCKSNRSFVHRIWDLLRWKPLDKVRLFTAKCKGMYIPWMWDHRPS